MEEMSIKQEASSIEDIPHSSGTQENSSCIGHDKTKRHNDSSSNKTSHEKKISKLNPFWGTTFILLAATSIQLISVIVKEISYISISQLTIIRCTGIFVVSLPVAVFHTHEILGEKEERCLLFLRAFLGAAGMAFQIAAYRYLQLVQASVVMSTLPFMTAVLARILLKEPLGVVEIICLIITICGVLMTLRLPETLLKSNNFNFDFNDLIGYASSSGFVLCMSLSTVAIRKLRKAHFSIILLYSGFIGISQNVLLNATVFPLISPVCGWDVILCALLGILGFSSNCFVVLAFQKAPAGVISVQKCCFEILVIAVFEFVFFSVYPDWYATVGACLVITSLVILGVKNWILTMPQTSKQRQKFKWMLSY